ncbi:TPA: hypothetical protein OMS40_003952 [Klebsiella aerogenes]|nr:hypothetical protein [Klebsiella aerogenes]
MKELTFPGSSNDEIVQTAQKNDMSVEFVRWFFNEKKAACGEQWFLALGAMWEGWKAREGEATALALTLEKSREAAGCPAGVDLQDWVKKLAAESVALRDAITTHSQSIHFCEVCGKDDPCINDDVCYVLDETPAIDVYLAGVKADGAKAAGDYLKLEAQHMPVVERLMMQDAAEICYGTAAMLREGADK